MQTTLDNPAAAAAPASRAATLTAEDGNMTVEAVVLGLLRDPMRHLIWRWNWKSALLSSLLRAGCFLLTNLSAGWHAALGAMLAELVLRSITSGFYGAITEAFSAARPAWKATAASGVGLPVLSHSIELLVHWIRRTPNLGLSIGVSVLLTAISTSFNLYAMRRGVFKVGGGSKSLGYDLMRFPGLLLGFALAGPRALIRLLAADPLS